MAKSNNTLCLDKFYPEKDLMITVFCKPFLDKVAKHFWTLLHVQIGQSCKALVSLIK